MAAEAMTTSSWALGRRAACWPTGCRPTPRAGWCCWRRAGRTGRGRSGYRWGSSNCFRPRYDWNYRTTRQPQLSDRELYWPRGKTLGGSSSINGQAWTRGHRVDYDGWAESCPGWSYDEVLPYFRRAERRVGSNAGGVYGTSGPQFISELRDPNPTTSAFLAACAELGMRRLGELNEPDNTGYCTDGGDPAPRAAAQRRGRLPAPRKAATAT